MDDVARALILCFNGHPHEVPGAQELLDRASQDPAFVEYLIHLVASPGDQTVQLAAAIQLRRFVARNNDEGNLTIEKCIELVMRSPPLVQLQLKLLMKVIVRIVAEGDRFRGLFEMACDIAKSDNEGLGGVILLRYLLKMAPRVVPGIGDRTSICQSAVVVLPSVIERVQRHANDCLLMHETLRLVKQLCLDSSFAVAPWLQIVCSVFNQNVEWETYPYLDKDAGKLADSLLAFQKEASTMELFVDVFVSMCERIRRNACSYQAVIACCSYFLQFAMCSDLWVFVSHLSSDLLEHVFLPVFVPTEDDIRLAHEDLLAFVSKFDVVTDGSIDSPVSGVALCLSKAAARQENVINQVLEISFRILSSGNLLHQTGVLLFLGYALEHQNPSDRTAQLFEALKPLAKHPDIFLQGFYFLMLTHINHNLISDITVLFQCFETLLSSQNFFLKYSAASAIGNLIGKFSDQKSVIIETITPSLLMNSITVILELNHLLPTDSIASCVSHFVNVFSDEFSDAASHMITEILSLYSTSLLSGDDNYTQEHLLHTTLVQLISTLQPSDFLMISERVCELACQVTPNHYESICDLLLCLTKSAPTLTNEYAAIFPILKQMAMNDGIDALDSISEIVETLIRRGVPAASSIHDIGFLCELGLQFLLDEDFSCFPSTIRLTECLFILLRDCPSVEDIFPQILASATTLNDPGFADGYAALAGFHPIPTFSNECTFKIWLHHTTDTAFLSSAPNVIALWDSLPDAIRPYRDRVIARLTTLAK